jgi:hypothetical protein
MRHPSRPTGFACLLTLALMGAHGAVYAEDSVIREYSFPLDGIEEISIKGNVGSMHFIETDKPEITLVLEISRQDDHWFKDDVDLDTVELNSRVRNGRLMLEQTEEETETEWTIEMPARASTEIDLGVGEIEGEFGATELRIDLGVGEVDIAIPETAVGAIDLSTGVGEANLAGASTERENRAFVSHDVRGEGKGTLELDVHVGVGEIDVHLTDDGGSI